MGIRVGILGGTFNPIHRGHIDLGTTIRDTFKLEKVLYILAARPPHKKNDEIVPAEIRWKMLSKALEPFPYLEACDIEMKRIVDSWTIDTIEELSAICPGCEYYFISGSEGFLKIGTWKNYKKLLRMIPFIVVLRNETHKAEVEQLLKEEELEPCYEIPKTGGTGKAVPRIYIYSYRSDKLFISSTLIRQKVRLSEPVDDFVDEEVKKVMEEYRLYENRRI